MPDVIVADQGSIVSFMLNTASAREWVDRNCQVEPWQWLGGNLCVDWRCGESIIEGMQADGLDVTN